MAGMAIARLPSLRTMKKRLVSPIVVLLALAASCFQGARAPNVTPRGVLAVAGEAADAKAERAFGVVFGSPRGETTDPSEISIVFNRPMRPLDLAGDETAPPVRIMPAVKGTWRWVGTSAVVFQPDGHLPRSTDFRVQVPAGTRALDGSVLDRPYDMSFATPRPKIERSDPSQGSDDLTPASKIVLRWTQPVSDAETIRAVTLSAGAAKEIIPFSVRRPDPANAMLAEIVPRRGLPLDSDISLVVAPTLRGTEGPRQADREQRLGFRTYGPLAVAELDCDRDTPHKQCAASYVGLRLSNAVRFGDLKRAITISPPLKIRWGDLTNDDKTHYVHLAAPFVPGRKYAVRVSATLPDGAPLRDEHGQSLGADWARAAAFDDDWPSAEVGVNGTYLEAAQRRDVPVLSVNVASMKVLSMALADDDVLALAWDGHGRDLGDLFTKSGTKAATVVPAGPKNTVAKNWLGVDEILGGKDNKGPVAVQVLYTHRPGTSEARETSAGRVFQVTDLGITAKVSREGTLVWVTHLSSGAPVDGANVEVRRPAGSPRASSGVFKTDSDGFATVPKSAFAPVDDGSDNAVIFVRTADDRAYRRVDAELGAWRYGADVDSGRPDRAIGMVFTERGLYRPGDAVKIKGIARYELPRGTLTPAGKPVRMTVQGPDGEDLGERSAAFGAFGTFSVDLKLPETAKLGSYSIGVHVDGRKGADFGGHFEVAEYRAAEFKVAVESAKESYVRGDKAAFAGRGDYLFGAPMSQAGARHTITRSPASFSPPLPEGFTTREDPYSSGLADTSPRSNEVARGEQKLDEKGRLAILTALPMPGQRGPELLTCELEVSDLSRQTIAGSSSVVVHPGEVYVALKANVDLFSKPGGAVSPEILAVDPRGAKKGSVAVHLDLVRRTYGLARQAQGGGDLHSVVSAIDTVVQSCDVTTRDAPVSCAVVPPSGGYYILHATASDRRGNKVGAASSFYVIGEGEGGWGDNDERRVDLVPDRATYEIGQTARVLVKSPWKAGEALVTVERAGVFSQRRVKLSVAMPTIDVPITEDMRPNVFVSVLMVRGRTGPVPKSAREPDLGAPAFRAGYAALMVDQKARRLDVAVKPNKDRFAPGDNVDVDVVVRDAKGRGAVAEVTLYAVDEGVLSLIGYKTPDPVAVLNAPRPLRVSTVESREAIGRVVVLASPRADGMDKGLEGGGGGEASRRDFRQSVYFNPSLVTGADGLAHASFKLPDSLTAYRLMAVAVAQDDRSGSAESVITASKALMARPAFPRTIRAGDVLDAGVVVTSKGLGRTKIEVQVAAEGIALTGAAKVSADLEADGSTEVRFPMKAERAGRAKLTFRVRGGGVSDAVEVVRTVASPASLEAVALYGDTSRQAGERLGDLGALRDDTGGLEMSVSSTALVGLKDGVDQLIEYPYGCTEQLTSRLVPLLPLRDLAREHNIPLPRDVDTVAAKTVALVLANQRDDGGFGLFADSTSANRWVTVYALWGLGVAKRHGVSVPAASIDRAASYVRHRMSEWQNDAAGSATLAFALDVLAENGSPDQGWMSRLFESRSKLPLFGEAMLAHAAAVAQADRKTVDELVRDLEAHVRIDGPNARAVANTNDRYAAVMDSEARTSALVLRALVAASPSHPMAARLAMGLLADRKGGSWRSTQETAWALLALSDYRKAQEKTEPAFDARVFVGNVEVLSAPFRGRSVSSARAEIASSRLIESGGSTLAFSVEGTGRLFYEARLRYARKELPTRPLDRGFFVKKTMRAVRPEELASAPPEPARDVATKYQGGDLVLADVIVVTPSPRQFVVIDDPLPAGLEPVDASLSTTAGSLAVGSAEATEGPDDDRLATGNAFLSDSVRRELRDDRVLFFVEHMAAGMHRLRYLARATTLGTFVMPPTRAEEMYSPETFGRTAAGVVEVRKGP
jgi:alpha-2-macroglobulin